MVEENEVDQETDRQQADGQHCNHFHLIAESLEIFKQFLLLERIAIGGFAHHLQLVLNAF